MQQKNLRDARLQIIFQIKKLKPIKKTFFDYIYFAKDFEV